MGCDFRFVASLQDSQLECIDSWLMVGVFGKLLGQDFFLAVSRDNKEVHLVCIGKLVVLIVIPQDVLIINIIGTEMLCMNNHT